MSFEFRKSGFTLLLALVLTAIAPDAIGAVDIGSLGPSGIFAKNEGFREFRDDETRTKAFKELRKGNWAGAKALFERVLAGSANDALSLYGLSVATFNLGEIKEAQGTVEKAIKLLFRSGGNSRLMADCYVLSAVILANQKENERAIERLTMAIKLHPDHYDANISLARAYFGNGDLENAALFFRKAIALRPTDIRARFFLATTEERLGNSKKALKEYREILSLDQNSIQGNLGLGVLLLKEYGSASAEGIEALERVIAVRSDVYEARITLGKTFVRLKKYEESLPHLMKAIELAPTNPEPHYQISIAYRRLGRISEAKRESEIVKRIHRDRRKSNLVKKGDVNN